MAHPLRLVVVHARMRAGNELQSAGVLHRIGECGADGDRADERLVFWPDYIRLARCVRKRVGLIPDDAFVVWILRKKLSAPAHHVRPQDALDAITNVGAADMFGEECVIEMVVVIRNAGHARHGVDILISGRAAV